MARKRGAKKTSSSRKSVRNSRTVRKSSRKISRRARSTSIPPKGYAKRFSLAWKNFVFFVILGIIFFVLYKIINNVLLHNFFGILAAISGIVAAALLIAFIVLAILKSGRK